MEIDVMSLYIMVRGVGFEPTQAYASGSWVLRGRYSLQPPLTWLGHPRYLG